MAAGARETQVWHAPRERGEGQLGPAAEETAEPDGRVERIWHTLRRAISRACPPQLGQLREDLVQAALLRVLEREEPTRSATCVWRMVFSVVTNELRRQRRRDEASAAIDSHEFVLRWNAAAGL